MRESFRKKCYHELTKERDELIEHLDKLAIDQTSITNPKANAIAVITAIRKLASIQSILSDLADLQTKRIVRLTWALVILTAALLVFTAALYEDAHAQIQHDNLAKQQQTQHP
jgi:hypothetical protein